MACQVLCMWLCWTCLAVACISVDLETWIAMDSFCCYSVSLETFLSQHSTDAIMNTATLGGSCIGWFGVDCRLL
jgi:hypothetical protein